MKMGAGHFVIAMNDKPQLSKDQAPLFSRPSRQPKPQAPAAMQAEASVALPERFRGVMH
jgi:hypothetical protein